MHGHSDRVESFSMAIASIRAKSFKNRLKEQQQSNSLAVIDKKNAQVRFGFGTM